MNDSNAMPDAIAVAEHTIAVLFIFAPGLLAYRVYEARAVGQGRTVRESILTVTLCSFVCDATWLPIYCAAFKLTNDIEQTGALVACGLGIIATALGIGVLWFGLSLRIARARTAGVEKATTKGVAKRT